MPYVQANGIQLYYEERGTGDPLLMVMGITAPGSVWEKHVAHWSSNFRCIMPDNRGVGFSDKPEGQYTTAQMADDCAALLDQLNITKANVVGVSMGGAIVQQLAIRHPEKVHAIVQMCPWARCDRKGEAVFKHMIHAKAHLRPEDFANFVQQLIYHKSSWDDDTVYEELMQAQQDAANGAFPQPLHGLEGQAAACISHYALDELPKIKQPCLVIGGKDDSFIPAWMVREVAEAMPNSELHLYEETGHAFHWEKIEDFNNRVLDWLKAHV